MEKLIKNITNKQKKPVKSLKAHLRKIQRIHSRRKEEAPSSLCQFALAIRNKFFSRRTIILNLNELVEYDDHIHLSAAERKQLIAWLIKLSNLPEEGKK